MLHKAPSLSVFNDPISEGFGEAKDVGVKTEEEVLERTVTIGEAIGAADGEEFSFRKKGMGLIEEEGEEESGEVVSERSVVGSPPLCLASGIGIDGGVGLDLDLSNLAILDGGDDLEEYYQRMIEQCPFHPLFLRNFAQLLQVGHLYIFLCVYIYICVFVFFHEKDSACYAFFPLFNENSTSRYGKNTFTKQFDSVG